MYQGICDEIFIGFLLFNFIYVLGRFFFLPIFLVRDMIIIASDFYCWYIWIFVI